MQGGTNKTQDNERGAEVRFSHGYVFGGEGGGNGDADSDSVSDGITHESFVPKNLSSACVTNSEWVIVISCPAPSTVKSSDDGM